MSVTYLPATREQLAKDLPKAGRLAVEADVEDILAMWDAGLRSLEVEVMRDGEQPDRPVKAIVSVYRKNR